MNRWMSWVAVAPSVLGGTMLWLAGLALLPSAAAGIAACVFAGLVSWLFVGGAERQAVLLVAQGRILSKTESDLVAPSREFLAAHDLAIGDLYVSRQPGVALGVQPVGRRSLLISPVLLERLGAGSVERESIAIVLAHAEGRRLAAGSMRHDVAARFVGLPWLIATDGLKRVGRILGWVPGTRFLPPIALVLGGTAVYMAAVDQVWWLIGVLLAGGGLLVGTPLAERARLRQLRDAADDLLVAQGLGTPLLRLVGEKRQSADVVRVRRVERLVHRPRPSLHLVPSAAGFDAGFCDGDPNSSESAVLSMERPK